MKQLCLLLIALPFLLVSCAKDDEPNNILRHDDTNQSAPNHEAGTHEMAVQFSGQKLNPFLGRFLEEITFFVGPVPLPTDCELRIYSASRDTRGSSIPKDLVYRADILNAISADGWNNVLIDPLEITGEDIWVSIRFSLQQQQQFIGCDSGPNRSGGDWIYRSTDNDWRTFGERTSGRESVNWNIRGIVSE